tara:strand:- start:5 stop:388 length:384 start_codon:yes stop_codon:yes gene_type:complete
MITKPNGSLILSAKQAPGGTKVITLLLFAICLCACLPERFRHEKYDCSGSLPNINTIVINKARAGNYAKIVSPTSETKANITQIDEQTAWLTYKNMQMKINRKTGAMTMVHGTKYIKVGCKKTVFTM